jgi:hypothetical protein
MQMQNERSNSSASTTVTVLPLPSNSNYNFNNTADKSNICPSCKICPKIEVVVLPCVPATAKQKYLGIIPKTSALFFT